MPKVITANIDSDSIYGNRTSPAVHALRPMCYCRLVAWQRPARRWGPSHQQQGTVPSARRDRGRTSVVEVDRSITHAAIGTLFRETGRTSIKPNMRYRQRGNTVVTAGHQAG